MYDGEVNGFELEESLNRRDEVQLGNNQIKLEDENYKNKPV